MVKTGRSGASVLVEPRCNVSQDVIAVKVRRERVNPYFLAVYLNTSFGSSEMNRWFQGQVQPHLSLGDARRILIAITSDDVQREIEILVKAAASLRSESAVLYTQANEFLASELGLGKVTFKKPVGYTALLSEVESSRRMDSEHYFPAFRAFQSSLPSHIVLTPLGRHLDYCQRGKQRSKAAKTSQTVWREHILRALKKLGGNPSCMCWPRNAAPA